MIVPPHPLGRYELVELLGEGGMGQVWLAKLTGAAGFEKPCLIKTVLPSLASDSTFVERFKHEARVLVQLAHPNIGQVYELAEADGVLFMALEYISGVDLDRLRQKGPLPVALALFVARHIAAGLGYAHRKAAPDGTPLRLVHRDVSPHNVMVSYEGEVRVIDFGLAASVASARLTQPATVMGKLGYMSPEQASGQSLDARTDLYSCGVILWELLAGRPMISPAPLAEMVAAMTRPQARPLSAHRTDVDTQVEALVAKTLAVPVDQRWQTADELVAALDAAILRLGQPVGLERLAEWVREHCPQEWSLQQQRLSRLTTQSAVVETQKVTPRPLPAPIEPTVISTPAAPIQASDSMLAASVRRPRTALWLSLAVAALAASGAALWWGTSGRGPGDAGAHQATGETQDPSVLAGSFPDAGPQGVARPAGPPDAAHDLPDAGAVAAAPTPPADAGVKAARHRAQLRADVQVTNVGAAPNVRIKNLDSFRWTRCEVLLPGRYVMSLRALDPRFTRELAYSQFAPNPAKPETGRSVWIDCAEGSARFPDRF